MRRWWWLSLTAFVLLGTAWALALPANGTYDEKDHIARAYAVDTGQLTTDRTMVDRRGDRKPAFLAPASLLPSNATVDCFWSPRPPRTPSCQHWTGNHARIPTPSGAATYSPVYYLPVGIPLLLAPDLTGIVLSRIVSALLSALLLACAVAAAVRLGNRLLVVGVVLVCTPLAMNLAGSVNPNGLEISAGILVFCALLALLRAPADRLDPRATRRLIASAAVGAVLLLTVRELGPALLALDVAACLLLRRPGRLAPLWRRRDFRWVLGGCTAVGLAFAIGWQWYSGLTDIATNTRDATHLGTAQAFAQIATVRIPFYLRQLVGVFGYGDVDISAPARWVWWLLVAALVVPGLVRSRPRVLFVTAGLGVLSLGLLAALELYFLPRVGWFSQGRYAMPALVGVVLGPASGDGLARRLARRGWLRGFGLTLAAAAGAVQLYALARVMTRYQAGMNAPLDPFGGTWRAALGPLPPLLAALLGVLLLVALLAPAVADGTDAVAAPRDEDVRASTGFRSGVAVVTAGGHTGDGRSTIG